MQKIFISLLIIMGILFGLYANAARLFVWIGLERTAAMNDYSFIVSNYGNKRILEGKPLQALMVIKKITYQKKNGALFITIDLTLFKNSKNIYLYPKTGKPTAGFTMIVDSDVSTLYLNNTNNVIWHREP